MGVRVGRQIEYTINDYWAKTEVQCLCNFMYNWTTICWWDSRITVIYYGSLQRPIQTLFVFSIHNSDRQLEVKDIVENK